MAKLLGELLLELLRDLVGDLLKRAALKVGAWLDTLPFGRRTKMILGAILGVAAYFLFPIALGLLGL